MNDDTEAPATPGVAVVGGRPEPPATAEATDKAEQIGGSPAARRPRQVGGVLRRLVVRRPGGHRAGAGLRPGPGQPRWLIPVLLVVTALSLILAIGFGIAWSGLNSQQHTRAAARQVATQFLHDLTSFNPTNLDSRLSTLETFATGGFAKQANQFFGTSIRQALEQVQASSVGQVRYIYVQSLDGNQASVYAWVDQTYTNDKLTGNETDTLQLVLSMADTTSGWKISAVSVLNSSSSPATPKGSSGSGG